MPRIDPLRLLNTLKPLLNPETGGIKSEKEVDKIFVLMTKYSKKLVSKCTYLNIIEATSPDIRNAFMDRGGWDMLNTWTVEAKNAKNHVLLNEIIKLLLGTPASVSRLRTNSLPKEIKLISNKWDNEGTKTLAEQLVAHWISVAKKEEQQGAAQIAQQQRCTVSQQQHLQQSNSVSTSGSSSTTALIDNNSAVGMQDLGPMGEDSLNVLAENTIYDSEVQPTMDLDVDLNDLNEINFNDMDFNPDLFTKAIENLGDINATSAATTTATVTTTAGNEHAQIIENHVVHHPQQLMQHQQSQLQTVVLENTNTPSSVPSEAPTVPPILIKKSSGGQCAVITTDQLEQSGSGRERLCLINQNGQLKVVKVLRISDTTDSPIHVVTTTAPIITATQDQHVTSTVAAADSSSSSTASPSPEKKKRPRKDPTITAMKNSGQVESAADKPRILKTYSKKTNAELETKTATPPAASAAAVPDKDKAKSKSSDSSSKSSSKPSSSSSSKSRSSSSKSHSSKGSAAAAKAAAEAAEKEKLRLKVKEQKKKLKEREEAKKKSEEDKQKQKDDQTLKEIYGISGAPSVKIPKKAQKPSFTDLIGVPGASEDVKKEKITKEKSSSKTGGSSKDDSKELSATDEDSIQDATGFGSFTRPETKDIGPSKERKTSTVKVYVSSKSKNMDLLETMTKTAKGKGKGDADAKETKESSKPEKPERSMSFEEALAGAGAAIKPAKRPSVDSGSKISDAKKPKLDDSAKDSKKDKENKKKEEKKKESKPSSTSEKKKPQGIQESSLFMDALNATNMKDAAKAKRKRRLSSSTDSKEKEAPNGAPSSTSPATTTKAPPAAVVEEQPVTKPVFNFYRDTLNDEDEDDEKPQEQQSEPEAITVPDDEEVTAVEPPASPPKNDTDEAMDDAFAPAEGEGKLKSCLCIHRDRSKPKKGVRWREDDELKEYHFFEMDETERVNVTKQPKNFMEMKLMERTEEKMCLRRKMSGVSPPEEKMPWVLIPIDPSQLAGRPEVIVQSAEKLVQEERERGVLETFYFPGTALPHHPAESELVTNEADPNHIAAQIPFEDVPVLTKVSDYSMTPWPAPQGMLASQLPGALRNTSVPTPIPVNPLNPASAFVNAFGVPPPAASTGDLSNPWTQPFANIPTAAVTTAAPDPWTAAAEVPGFNAFAGLPNPQAAAAAANAFSMPFGFPFGQPGAAPLGNVPPMGPMSQGDSFGGFGPQNQFEQGPDNRPMGGRSRGDVDYRDMRRNHHDRDRDSRNRDGRPPGRDRERDRDRDRDVRDRRGDRDRFDSSRGRDHRFNDRRRGGARRSTVCSFFAKGFCREGNRCSFLHPGVNGPPLDDNNSSNNSSNNNGYNSRHKSSSPPHHHDRRRSPPSNSRDSFSNHLSSPSSSSSGPSSSNGPSFNNITDSRSAQNNPGIESPTPETDKRYTPPSSPSENHGAPVPEPVKVIPTFTEEDWG